jgi:hypothetical protein
MKERRAVLSESELRLSPAGYSPAPEGATLTPPQDN